MDKVVEQVATEEAWVPLTHHSQPPSLGSSELSHQRWNGCLQVRRTMPQIPANEASQTNSYLPVYRWARELCKPSAAALVRGPGAALNLSR